MFFVSKGNPFFFLNFYLYKLKGSLVNSILYAVFQRQIQDALTFKQFKVHCGPQNFQWPPIHQRYRNQPYLVAGFLQLFHTEVTFPQSQVKDGDSATGGYGINTTAKTSNL